MQHSQPKTRKLRVGVIFGGRSGEHEVSIASATSIIEHLDPNKYEVVPIAITQEGRWLLGADPQRLLAAETGQEGTVLSESLAVALPGDPTVGHLVPLNQPENVGQALEAGRVDVIFPVLHGTYGEDGTLQGLLEMAGVPYVGCGVLGSALGMDKEKMKMIFQAVGLPIVDYLVYRRHDWERDPAPIIEAVEARLGYPCFVKPVNLGSSVGVSKAHKREELEQAITFAAEYDRKIIVERGIDCRELECAVLGNDEPLASVVGEIIPSNEFYDYRAKYIDNRSQTVIPADLPQETAELVRHYAVQAFLALDLSGLARVDFFLEKTSGQLYINEVNTMPGFTTISMYPKLWQASGLPYEQLLDRLIELALERHTDQQRNRTRLQL
ncbi:D-alanine--D-alanine ligase family protein [Thermogemmatispora tikiterensis]|uniref:D-alanine--D-alanine ligase n=1 Tax=Thermogemmatispora tikiterensis TaxID=1825093 RepID=A0A328VGL8_9CHLR|nr:D-alanine--D-alanine ligase family protein [Thermogemmatispora tikiterensis]RAQ97058.1 D-alanine--D-alanine ligase A [Thermogemmatispora tikiterensis]